MSETEPREEMLVADETAQVERIMAAEGDEGKMAIEGEAIEQSDNGIKDTDPEQDVDQEPTPSA